MKKRKLKVGSVYRVFTVFATTEKQTGYYMDVLCTSEEGVSKILKCNPKDNKNYIGGDWFVGGNTNISDSISLELIANSIEEYTSSIPDIVPPKAIVYNKTFIDMLYITYCKLLGRETDEFV